MAHRLRVYRGLLNVVIFKRIQSPAVMAIFAGALLSALTTSSAEAYTPTRFTVVDKGKQGMPDLVLVPGLTSSREVWAQEAKLLSPHYRLHLVQVNGFAGQPAGPNAKGEILPGLTEELHFYCASLKTKPVLIGHSLGGLLALMLATKYPSDLKKIVIVDSLPFYGMMFGPQVTPAMIKPQAEQMLKGMETQDPARRKASAKQTAEQLALDPGGRSLVEKNSEDSDAHVMAESMFEDLQTDMRARLAQIHIPALMLYPFDPTLKIAGVSQTRDVDKLYQGAYNLPNFTTRRVDGSRHFIMLDQPKKFDLLLQNFLKK